MLTASFVGLAAIMVVIAVQMVQSHLFVRFFRRQPEAVPAGVAWPHAAVLLSVRGLDVGLPGCLDRLAALDYPSWELQVVVDHETDPAVHVIRRWTHGHPEIRVTTQFLSEISPGAYLKTSAVRQCLRTIPAAVQVVVIVDADTMVHPAWLKDMVGPMVGSRVGVVTGNRWYDPAAPGWGSLVRFVVNAHSVGPMYLMGATWAGSLGFRREVFDQPWFWERMLRTSSEESAIQESARRIGLDLVMQPNALLLNAGPIDVASCFRFMRRQLLWTRLYHTQWWWIVAQAAALYGTLVAIGLGLVAAAWRGDGLAAASFGGTIVVVMGINLAFVEYMHRLVSERMRRTGNLVAPPIGLRTRLRLLAALTPALVVHTWATFAAAVAREVSWSGIRYRVEPPDQLRLVEYRPVIRP